MPSRFSAAAASSASATCRPAIKRPDNRCPMREFSANRRRGLFCDSAIKEERRGFALMRKRASANLLLCHNAIQRTKDMKNRPMPMSAPMKGQCASFSATAARLFIFPPFFREANVPRSGPDAKCPGNSAAHSPAPPGIPGSRNAKYKKPGQHAMRDASTASPGRGNRA